jgi:hypothetical protein
MNHKHFLNNKIVYEGQKVTNIFKKFTFVQDYKNNSRAVDEYDLVGGETPEMVAYKVYGTVDYWWVVCLFNDIFDPLGDWYLSHREVEILAQKMLPTWETDTVAYTEKLEELHAANDLKKKIKILKPFYIEQLMREVRDFNK